jgi:hypothetical protein
VQGCLGLPFEVQGIIELSFSQHKLTGSRQRPQGVLKERNYANPEDSAMNTTTLNKLYIIKKNIQKQDKLYRAQLEMAKKTQA